MIHNVCEDRDLPGLDFEGKTMAVIKVRGGLCGYLCMERVKILDIVPVLDEQVTGEELL